MLLRVSHELKNPIARSIIAHVENFTPKDDEDEAALNKIKEQAIRMNKLISEISEAAIVDNDLVTQSKERFDLSNTVNEIISHYSETNDYAELNLSSNIDRNVVLLGLPERIGQVLVNLLDNAISFQGQQGISMFNLKKKWRRKPLLSWRIADQASVKLQLKGYLTGFIHSGVDVRGEKMRQV